MKGDPVSEWLVRGFIGIVCLALWGWSSPSLGIEPPQAAHAPVGKPEASYADQRFYPVKLNTTLGMTILHSMALNLGAQLGYAPFSGHSIYLGPEVNYSFFSPGGLLSALGGAWYELRVYGSPRLSVAMGA